MASENVGDWLKRYAGLARDPVLEIGSRRYGEFLDLRALFPDLRNVTGCDLEAGENVDVVLDITAGIDEIDAKLEGRRFQTIFCISVLEHIPNVSKACENIYSLLDQGGVLFLSVPFVFRFHAYPGDYWRFTPEAIKWLFRGLDFDRHPRANTMSTLERGELKPIAADFARRNRRIFRPKSIQARLNRKVLKRESPDAVRGDYSLAPAMINMIGVKRGRRPGWPKTAKAKRQ